MAWQITPVGDHGVKILIGKPSDQKTQEILEEMRKDPKNLRDRCASSYEDFWPSPFPSFYLLNMQPECFLGECVSKTCRYGQRRDDESCPRTQAVNLIVEKSGGQPKVVVSYGAGKLFFDLEVVTRLVDEGKHIEKVVLVDPLYETLVKTTRMVGRFDDFDARDLLTRMPMDLDHKRSLMTQILLVDQFIRALKALSPDRAIELVIFPYAHEYATDALTVPEIKSDLIYGMDHVTLMGNSPAAANLDMGVLLWTNCLKEGGVMAEFSAIIEAKSTYPTRFHQKIGELSKDLVTPMLLQALFEAPIQEYEKVREDLFSNLPEKHMKVLAKTKRVVFETNPFKD